MALTDPLSFQLYSARKFPPLEDKLAMLTRYGYTNVEPFGALYEDAKGLRALLDRYGLTAKSGHFPLALVESERARAIAIARALEMGTIIIPAIAPDERPRERAGWQALGERLARIAANLRSEGLRLAWHNHDFEFAGLPDGSVPLEHLLAEGVEWEPDLAWIVKAGADPRAWLERYRGRISFVHVKDIAPAGEKSDEDGWADVGQGTMPWADLWKLSVAVGAQAMVAEHDNPSDVDRFARVSAAAMSRFAKEGN